MKPVAYMVWAPFTGPAQFTTDPRAPSMTAQRAEYTCTPLITEHDALAAVEQARREAFEEAAKVVEHSGGFDTHVRAQLAAAIRARGATGVYTQEDLDWAKQRAEERAKRIKVE